MNFYYNGGNKLDSKVSNVNMYKPWWEDKIPQNIIEKKYMHDDELKIVKEQGFEAGFVAFVKRVSSIFSTKELQDFMQKSIIDGTFLPAGRTLYAAGCKGKFRATTSNCYILPSPNDNIESIFDVGKEMARIFSFGGGAGINLSNLRPKGAKVNNSAKTSSGAVSFMDIYNVIGEVIGNNGRRSAILISLNCDHPDIEDFLIIKQNNNKIQGANISICFTDEFLQDVLENKKFELHFKNKENGEEIKREIDAGGFFKKFCEAQYDWGEPGALFIDKVREWHLLSGYPIDEYRIDTTNPCGEFAGSEYNACNLGSINLYNFVDDPYTDKAHFNMEYFCDTVKNAVTILDEILDYGYDLQPLDKNRKCIDDWRSIGLGIFGMADMFVAMGIKYGSDDSIILINDIMRNMQTTAYVTSAKLGEEKGSFGKFDKEKFNRSIMVHDIQHRFTSKVADKLSQNMRNGTLLSIAPTGSISMLFRESGGVEPYYQVSYDRTTHVLEKEGKSFHINMLAVENLLKFNGYDPSKVSVKEIKEKFPYVVDTYDVEPKDRITLQANMQFFVDNAISSTINLKENATVDDIFDLYLQAWEMGCKGITIFRDNCKRINILGTDHGVKRADVDKKVENPVPKIELIKEPVTVENMQAKQLDYLKPIKRNGVKSLWGRTFVYHTACVRNFYVTVNVKDNHIFEVFVGAETGCQANISTIARLTSYALRLGGKALDIADELSNANCPACSYLIRSGRKDVSKSCASCIASAIRDVYKDLQTNKEALEDAKNTFEKALAEETQKAVHEVKEEKDIHNGRMKCPECGEYTLIPDGKCAYCNNCGYSKC